VIEQGVTEASATTIWRWLHDRSLKPWQQRSWIFPRDPDFQPKAGRVLDLYARRLEGRLLHPGDSFHSALDAKKGIDILALPVMAPWNTELMVAAFATRLAPRVVIPIHDGYGKDFFVKMRHDNYKNYFAKQNIEFVSLAEPGASFER